MAKKKKKDKPLKVYGSFEDVIRASVIPVEKISDKKTPKNEPKGKG